jgi:hypothetical protein
VIELSKYTLEILRKDEEFVLYRAQREEISSRILVLSPTAEYPAPEILKSLEHAYPLKKALDRMWAARPIAIVHCGDAGANRRLVRDRGERAARACHVAGGEGWPDQPLRQNWETLAVEHEFAPI